MGADATAYYIQDSADTDSALSISTTRVGIGTAAPIGKLHIESADTGSSVSSGADELVLEGTSDMGMSFLSSTSGAGIINFGDSGDNNIGYIEYQHGDNSMRFGANAGTRMKLDGNSRISLSNNDSGGTTGRNSTSGNTLFGYLAGNAIIDGGVNNTLIGHNSGALITTGDDNVSIGADAMDAMQGGGDNVAIGRNALGSMNHADADNNIAIGRSALLGGTIGTSHCIAMGYTALESTAGNAQTGTIAIGNAALNALTTGAENTVVGYLAADALVSGGSNCVFGHSAFTSASNTETANIAIGQGAMASADEGDNGVIDFNVAIGHSVLTGGDLGSSTAKLERCIAIGANALNSTGTTLNSGNIAQTGTIAIGYDALTSLTIGLGNVALGYQALAEHSTGSKNIAIGYQAMYQTSGVAGKSPASTDNIFVGYQAGGGNWEDDEDSNYNIAIGNYVLDGALDGALSNIGIGYSTLSGVLTGDYNVAVGQRAGLALTSGSNNTIYGSNAGYTSTAVSNTVLIGNSAGYSGMTTDANGTVCYW